jgi:tetratricopeptide (TPR) repeat protein
MVASTPSGSRDRIFISYRRDGARGASARVWDWLRIGFGRERVFRMVRYELEKALAYGESEELEVEPLLVEDADLKAIPAAWLPDALQPLLAEWNVLELSESGWDDDTRRLIEAIAAATGLPVQADLEEWLALMAGAERGLAGAVHVQEPSIGAKGGEQQALENLLRKVAEAPANERPGLRAAFEALAAGDSRLAEEAFEREVESSERVMAAAAQLLAAEQRKKAEAARNVASLAVVRGDLSKAVRYFEKALEAVPDDLNAAMQLGYAWIALGSLKEAAETFSGVLTRARDLHEPTFEAWGQNGQGDVLVAQGDGPAALRAYQEGLAIREALAKRDPANTAWQVDVAVSCSKLGSFDSLLSAKNRKKYLLRGQQILLSLKEAGRLHANQDWTGWFDQALDSLE